VTGTKGSNQAEDGRTKRKYERDRIEAWWRFYHRRKEGKGRYDL